MPENVGKYPLDPTTPVGRFRVLSRDKDGTPIEPPVPAVEAEYAFWSDAEIEVYIAEAGGSIPLAISLAYAGLAATFSASGASEEIKTDDLTYKAGSQVAEWERLSAYWLDRWSQEMSEGDDGFRIVQTGAGDCWSWPEASPRPWCGPW